MNPASYTYPEDVTSPEGKRKYRAEQRRLHGAIRPRPSNGTATQAPPPPDHVCPTLELIPTFVPAKKYGRKGPSRRQRAEQESHYLGHVAGRLQDLAGIVENSKSEIESLYDELDSWKQNLAENLQESDTGQRLAAALELLEQVKDALEEVDLNEAAGKVEEAEQNLSSVEFPGMFNK